MARRPGISIRFVHANPLAYVRERLAPLRSKSK